RHVRRKEDALGVAALPKLLLGPGVLVEEPSVESRANEELRVERRELGLEGGRIPCESLHDVDEVRAVGTGFAAGPEAEHGLEHGPVGATHGDERAVDAAGEQVGRGTAGELEEQVRSAVRGVDGEVGDLRDGPRSAAKRVELGSEDLV